MTGMTRIGLLFLVTTFACGLSQPDANDQQRLHKLRAERQEGDGPFTGAPPGAGDGPTGDKRNQQERTTIGFTVDGVQCAWGDSSGYTRCTMDNNPYSWCYTDYDGNWDACCWGECQYYEPWWGGSYWFCYTDTLSVWWDYC